MKRTLLVLLVLGVAFAAVAVHAQEGSGGSGGSGGEEAPKPKPAPKKKAKAAPKKAKAAKPAAAAKKGGAPYSADIPLEALSALPVAPLSMDSAALKDDDRMFDQLPKQLSGEENVEKLTESLKKAASLLTKMKRDVESEKVWTKNVYDIIQNYQYKYEKTRKDVRMRSRKVRKMEKLVALLKQSTLHKAVEKELTKASKTLSELVTRAGKSGGAKGTAVYTKITSRMQKLKNALANMPRPEQLYTDTTSKMKRILRTKTPPKTIDALARLAGTAAPAVSGGKKAKKSKKSKKSKNVKKAKKPKKSSSKKAKKAKKPKAKKAKKF